ncbi:hypothetical protein ACFHWD_20370 [Clostridium sp. MT-14]|uniref:Uncharacterized protein n=1 Tax=Clostridium aromativorans TaxID=2836848 RepID=A0ABS8NDS3_9CLOT|nr:MULTISPECIES: hypothetical protein [Clostridium]KAA8674423.1 hypothetical protein F3O63_07835 [Clostridium sp. HV4-5-A1G]MCC9296868.1 hypothetical protein [Clostridium aromativorans]CAB1249184.1 hypothetical protein CLOSBL3_11841 [Clostridiaceae bacterium BL-3]
MKWKELFNYNKPDIQKFVGMFKSKGISMIKVGFYGLYGKRDNYEIMDEKSSTLIFPSKYEVVVVPIKENFVSFPLIYDRYKWTLGNSRAKDDVENLVRVFEENEIECKIINETEF